MFVAFNHFHKPREFVAARVRVLDWLNSPDRAVWLASDGETRPSSRSLSETELSQIEGWLDDAWQGSGFGGYGVDEATGEIKNLVHFSLAEETTQANLTLFVGDQAVQWPTALMEGLSELLQENSVLLALTLPGQANHLLAFVRGATGDDDWQANPDDKTLRLVESANSVEVAEETPTLTGLAAAGGWLELSVRAVPEAVEPITELFAAYGYNQGVVIEETVKPGPDGGASVDPTAPVMIRTYISATDHTATAQLEKLREGLFYLGRLLPIEELQVTERREEDWANAWKEFYQVHRVGRRTVIKPPWQDYTPQPDDIIIEIDPGMAFGTGLHPTTRLCLQLMEDHLDPTRYHKVLDLGTGSGILAIASARLGVPYTLGLDTDPVAVAAAGENVARNGLTDRVTMSTGSLAVERNETGEGGFYAFSEEAQQSPAVLVEALPCDAVIANIIARVLIALAEPMAAALRPGGLLITSGIIAERAEAVAEALAAAGLTLLERREETDWIAFAHTKPTS